MNSSKSENPEKLNGKSADVLGERAEFFHTNFPEALTEGRLDCQKLKQALGEDGVVPNSRDERYNFTWAGKSNVFDAISGQTTRTLRPDEAESVNFEKSENIFIEGENLEVLKILQKSYYGKVKMIYIDPPYNTGNDFVYRDNFRQTQKEEAAAAENVDEAGNLKGSGLRKNTKTGRYHSNWLNMMYPRLFLARNLLRDDGVIFISIDDNEVHNLRMIMNEIFGEENFVAKFIWKSRQNKDNRNLTGVSVDHEYIVAFSKNLKHRALKGSERKKEQYTNSDNDSRGPWASGNMVGLLPEDQRPNCHYDLVNPDTDINYGKPKMGWRYDKSTMNKLIEEDRILWPDSKTGRPRKKVFFEELSDKLPGYSSIIGNDIYTRDGTSELEQLFNERYFEFPKPTKLIKELTKQTTDNGEIVLDFFAGSGTTAHAVMDLNAEDSGNRKCISVQLPEETPEDSEARKAGYETIAEIARERIRRAAKKIKEEQKENDGFFTEDFDGGFKAFKLGSSNFKHWKTEEVENVEALQTKLEDAIETKSENALELAMLYEIMLKLGLPLTAKIEGKGSFYLVANDTAVCLSENIDKSLVETVINEEPNAAVFLEAGFSSDELKTNTALQMKDVDVEFKVV